MTTTPIFRKLFEPLKIKNVTLKNRIVKAATWLVYPDDDGTAGERVCAHYEALAKGGLGLITTEECIADYPLGASNWPHIRLDDDRYINSLRKLAERVHKQNCPIFVQITYAGPAHNPQWDGLQPVAPSSIDPPAEWFMAKARELTVPEIKGIIEKLSQAALRVKKAGYDGVEVHAAHYAMVNSFLSRYQNRREDEYGCRTLEDRARFPVEILQRTRELVGPDFVVGIRMNVQEWGTPLSTTREEGVEFARMFEKAGADYIQASGYGYGIYDHCALPDLVVFPETPESARPFAESISSGALLPAAAAVKKAVSIPVSGVGRLSLEAAERALSEGLVDMVCFARALMADPEMPNKAAQGRVEDIRPCFGSSSCLHQVAINKPIECSVNPFLGYEHELFVRLAEKRKRVIVIGAGPAGLEAARMAAERGHQVMLYEKEGEIGGRLRRWALMKGSQIEDYPGMLTYYHTQLKKLGVTVVVGKEVTPEVTRQVSPDAVIVATGSQPVFPRIPGRERFHVFSTTEITQKLCDEKVGKRTVVVGGNFEGLITAVFLAKQGREVTVVEPGEQVGSGMNVVWMVKSLAWLKGKNVPIITGARCEEITSKGLTITTKDGTRQMLDADTVFIVTGSQEDTQLPQALKPVVEEVHTIPLPADDEWGYIGGAIHGGARVAMAV